MKVYKIEQPIEAFVFQATADGNNAKELSAEISAQGGSLEVVSDDLVRIHGFGGTFNLPINHALVIERGTGTVFSVDNFNDTYITAEDTEFDLDGLVAEVRSLHEEVVGLRAELTTLKPKAEKPEPKKAEKQTQEK